MPKIVFENPPIFMVWAHPVPNSRGRAYYQNDLREYTIYENMTTGREASKQPRRRRVGCTEYAEFAELWRCGVPASLISARLPRGLRLSHAVVGERRSPHARQTVVKPKEEMDADAFLVIENSNGWQVVLCENGMKRTQCCTCISTCQTNRPRLRSQHASREQSAFQGVLHSQYWLQTYKNTVR